MVKRDKSAGALEEFKALLNAKTPAAMDELVGRMAGMGEDGLSALRRAAKGSKGREERRVDVLLVLGDGNATNACAADVEVREIFKDATREVRDHALQVIGYHPSRLRFASDLREIVANRADPGWAWAVSALGELGDKGAVDVLMDHTRGVETPFVLLYALVKLRAPEGALVFEPNLLHPEARTRVFALWGLAALGFETPVAALVRLLDDSDVKTESSFTPGESLRAAQALSDVFGWPFEWDKAYVSRVRARCHERFTTEYLARCEEALARGNFSLERGPAS